MKPWTCIKCGFEDSACRDSQVTWIDPPMPTGDDEDDGGDDE